MKQRKKKLFCVWGHNISIVGRNKFGACNGCYDVNTPINIRKLKQFCPKGHDTFVCGRSKNRTCNLCRVEFKNTAEYKIKNAKICKKWDKKHPDARRRYNLKRYGITENQYNEILKNQDFRCAICRRHESEFKKHLSVDHNHKTGKIRGLLCSSCNHKILSLVENYSELLNNAFQYLKKYD